MATTPEWDNMLAAVTRIIGSSQSLIEYNKRLAQMLIDAKNEPAAVQAIADKLNAEADAVDAAVNANPGPAPEPLSGNR